MSPALSPQSISESVLTLRKMARHYMRQLPAPAAMRFDVLAIYFETGKPADFTLFKSAFGWSERPSY